MSQIRWFRGGRRAPVSRQYLRTRR